MGAADYVLLAVIALLAAAAIISIIKQHKKGGCCGQCKGCSMSDSCTKRRDK